LPIYDGIDIGLVDEAAADLISCTGLFDDETETPDDYADALARWKERDIPMLCANPDKIVERGHKLIWCAGAIAERYEAIGGMVVSLGKPHAPIFDASLERFGTLAGSPVTAGAILAIGDALETDLRGAAGAGIDALFVTAGIHADSYGPRENPDAGKVAAVLEDAGLAARAFIPHLTW
ncbi:MAG: HAD hydrolase-like protein, partial [Hyphomicrobiales bacterium]|nr:HAD hydrolase-like protein [Hyphomicrobiales bacterium]